MMSDNRTGSSRGLRLIASIAVAIALASSMAFVPAIAWAAEETRVYTWGANAPRPDIPSTIEVNGQTLNLKSTGTPVQADSSATVTQNFTKSIDSTCSESEIANIQNIIPSSYMIDQDGFKGNIGRNRIDYTPVYSTVEDVVEDTRVTMVTSNDENLIAETVTKDGRQLSLTGVDFKVASTDSSGNPTLYEATARYSGTFPRDVIDHYNCTAYYSGSLTKSTNAGDWSVSCVYASEAAANSAVPGSGVTATFMDVDSFDPVTGNANVTSNENQNTVATTNEIKNENQNQNVEKKEEAPVPESAGLPIVPIAIGAGILLVLALGAVIALRKIKDKKAAASPMTMEDDNVGPEEDLEPVYVPNVPEDFSVELIQYISDEDQLVLALPGTVAPETPGDPVSFVIPAYSGEGEFSPASAAEYYLLMSDIEAFDTDTMTVIVNGHEIYSGYVAEQTLLDTVLLTNALNDDEISVDERLDLTSELKDYAETGTYDFDGDDIQDLIMQPFVEEFAKSDMEYDDVYTEDNDEYYYAPEQDTDIHGEDYQADPEIFVVTDPFVEALNVFDDDDEEEVISLDGHDEDPYGDDDSLIDDDDGFITADVDDDWDDVKEEFPESEETESDPDEDFEEDFEEDFDEKIEDEEDVFDESIDDDFDMEPEYGNTDETFGSFGDGFDGDEEDEFEDEDFDEFDDFEENPGKHRR